MATDATPLKEGDRIRVGAVHAERFNYERIVGKEVTVRSTYLAGTYTRVHVFYKRKNGDESRWFIILEDAHPINPINSNYKHLLSTEEAYP